MRRLIIDVFFSDAFLVRFGVEGIVWVESWKMWMCFLSQLAKRYIILVLSSMTNKYVFSGHESFSCKSLWLKRGYDFLAHGCNFNSPDSVIQLGVGKNMVLSIRYWLRAFTLTINDELSPIADYIFNEKNGVDCLL
mgnify:CR=1 FL=1